jgi:acyl-CoA reductase-like NAD-dependent aldehyde dehydrogenase
VGDPALEGTDMGPLISSAHRDNVASFLGDARIAFQGAAPTGDGFWFPPTVVLAEPADRIAREEVFGPVVAVLPFDDEADAVRLANDTIYGLAGSLWTENLGRAVRVARGVKSGVLSVNSHASVRYWTPFGGMKASGLGRELGPDAAEHFTETKNVFFATDPG